MMSQARGATSGSKTPVTGPRSKRPSGSMSCCCRSCGRSAMDIYEIPLKTIDGKDTTLAEHADDAVLIVNVASKCGFTPQYEGLQRLHQTYAARGLAILGFPCNQFLGQEPGTHEEIQSFCSSSYGVTFPL